ncbi:MAG: hypothetical protein P4M09_14370 [Devosia sp.]|nr:hypothetical protein [Devosia sp.]
MDGSDGTIALLAKVPGGAEAIAMLGDDLEFGDAEVVSLHLDRDANSKLRLALPWKQCHIIFVLDYWVDVQLAGFSRQNVIGGMRLRRLPGRSPGPWELGVGFEPGDVEIELSPCYGANGTIRGRIVGVELEPMKPAEF